MRRIVIDTNVLIRAFLKNSGNDYSVYRQFLDGHIELYYSQELVDEFMEVISRPRLAQKYSLSNKDIRLFWEDIFEFGNFRKPKQVDICRDSRDNHIIGLALAVAEGAIVHLVTADDDLLVLKNRMKDVMIQTAKEFMTSKFL